MTIKQRNPTFMELTQLNKWELADLQVVAAFTKRLNMEQSSVSVGTSHDYQIQPPLPATFGLGERVRKKSGAAWQGHIVGWYSTKLTPEGYAVESEAHPGSVQIYPVSALERVA
jgi:dihydrofolate reductase (trimethoprim resistance protein)